MSEQPIEDILAAAEKRVKDKGARLTPIRRRVLQLLLSAEHPAKAYDLLDQLDGEGAAKPPTIYRALEFLQAQGLAHKIESLNAYVACCTGHSHAAAIFLICEICGATEELHDSGVTDTLQTEAADAGYTIGRAVIEARGQCANCQAAA